VSSDLDLISHHFRDTVSYCLKLSIKNCGQTAANVDMVTILTAYRKSPAPYPLTSSPTSTTYRLATIPHDWHIP